MFRIIWDKENNGVLLTTNGNGDALNVSPRPVFHEELNMLGFQKHWNYSESKDPLLWAMDRRYFYKGELVAEAQGGNIFDNPLIEITAAGQNLKLKPISIKKVVEKNQKLLFLLEQEAIEFIEQTYRTYSLKKIRSKAKANEEVDWALLAEMHEKNTKVKQAVVKQDCDSFDIMPLDLAKEQNKTVYLSTKIDLFVSSFSGGKDSQVTLDLVSRVIPPDNFMVVYSDTGMEIPPSLDVWEKAKSHYSKLYPELKFYLAKNKQDTFDYWKQFGAPSRLHRWCCTVTKTAPLYRLLKEVTGNIKQPNTFVYEGVRSEESSSREKYARLGKGVKHNNVINARPIFNWNTTEVFLYLFKRHLQINEGYRLGLNRVGCSICPYSSEWSEHIVNKTYPECLENQLSLIKSQLSQTGVKDVDNYIKSGNWKMRAGGKNTNNETSRIDIIQEKPNLEVVISNAKEHFFEWFKTLGKIYYKENNGIITGEIYNKKRIINFSLVQTNNEESLKTKISFLNIEGDPIFLSRLKKVLYKITYCIHCESCEVECPTGALKVVPNVTVNANKCTHCGNCLDFEEKGCLFAKSLNISEGGKSMNTNKINIDRYSGFGLRENWLSGFFLNINNYFETEQGLGSKQIPAVINWLRDAELLNRDNKKATETALILSKLYDTKPNLVWEIIWINLAYNSTIVKWYLQEIGWNISLQKNELESCLCNSFPDLRERTLHNGLEALVNMFKESKLGGELHVGHLNKQGQISTINKQAYNNVSPIAIAYSLYRYANAKNHCNLTVSEIYAPEQKQGVYKEFGLSKDRFQNVLRTIQENKFGVIKVDLVMGLDNISLRDDLTYTEVLKLLLEK
jgi:phosphoadenosine phosphosulfate reductase